MVSFALGYVGNFLFYVIQFFQLMWVSTNSFYNKRLLNLKCELFNNKIITHGFYDKEEKCYMVIYDYDNLMTLLYLYFYKLLFNRGVSALPVFGNTPRDLASDRFIFVGSFIKNNVQYNAIIDGESGKLYNPTEIYKKNFIYCIIDDKYDITHLCEHYRNSLMVNQSITSEDMMAILIMLSKRKDWIENAELTEFKLMMDDNFEELVFKAKDKLIINR